MWFVRVPRLQALVVEKGAEPALTSVDPPLGGAVLVDYGRLKSWETLVALGADCLHSFDCTPYSVKPPLPPPVTFPCCTKGRCIVSTGHQWRWVSTDEQDLIRLFLSETVFPAGVPAATSSRPPLPPTPPPHGAHHVSQAARLATIRLAPHPTSCIAGVRALTKADCEFCSTAPHFVSHPTAPAAGEYQQSCRERPATANELGLDRTHRENTDGDGPIDALPGDVFPAHYVNRTAAVPLEPLAGARAGGLCDHMLAALRRCLPYYSLGLERVDEEMLRLVVGSTLVKCWQRRTTIDSQKLPIWARWSLQLSGDVGDAAAMHSFISLLCDNHTALPVAGGIMHLVACSLAFKVNVVVFEPDEDPTLVRPVGLRLVDRDQIHLVSGYMSTRGSHLATMTIFVLFDGIQCEHVECWASCRWGVDRR
jgi:hypothetical protein